MEISPQIQEIKVGSIDEVEWLKIRQTPDDPDTEQEALHHLGLSMKLPASQRSSATAAAAPQLQIATPCPAVHDNDPTWGEAFLDMPVGQLAPVRVIRYPQELNRFGKDYGLIFGYRRWYAAKQEGLPTIKAQILLITAEEYHDPKIIFHLQLMGFTENLAREPLTRSDYYKAVKRLKAQYDKAHPETTTRFKHLIQEKDTSGKFQKPTRKAPESFAKKLRKITKKSKTSIENDIQIAEFLNLAIFDRRYATPLKKSAALLLTQLPQEEQTTILDELAAKGKPFTIHNIETAIAKSKAKHSTPTPIGNTNRHHRKLTVNPDSGVTADSPKSKQLHAPSKHTVEPIPTPHDRFPNLTLVPTITKLCLDLRQHYPWNLTTIEAELPSLADLASASQLLVDYLREQRIALRDQDGKTTTRKGAGLPNATQPKHAHAH